MCRVIGESLRDGDTQPGLPRIKYLIIFPDGYDFEGPKEFSIIDRDGVLTLTLQNLRNLPQAILQTTRDEKLDSRMYRKWIEDGVLRKKDDSMIGTWLDPAFDKIEAEPKAPFWRLGRSRDPEALAEKEELRLPDTSRTRSIQTISKWSRSRVILAVTTGIVIGTVGWRLYHDSKAATSVSRPRPPVSPPPSDKTMNAAQVIQTAMPQNNPSLAENQERTVASAARISTRSEAPEPESTAKNQFVESAQKSPDRSQDSQDAKINRQKIELQIRHAIRLRAITGVTVNFTGHRAYLNGQVHTESQRSAAEKAARSVSGVKEVRNSIVVTSDG
jgi:osmotically-inducible protein OsmY